jgi:hypothetical protein
VKNKTATEVAVCVHLALRLRGSEDPGPEELKPALAGAGIRIEVVREVRLLELPFALFGGVTGRSQQALILVVRPDLRAHGFLLFGLPVSSGCCDHTAPASPKAQQGYVCGAFLRDL